VQFWELKALEERGRGQREGEGERMERKVKERKGRMEQEGRIFLQL